MQSLNPYLYGIDCFQTGVEYKCCPFEPKSVHEYLWQNGWKFAQEFSRVYDKHVNLDDAALAKTEEYKMLLYMGHSPMVALQICIDARKGEQHSMDWIAVARMSHKRREEWIDNCK
jgi:hypothetical protein